MSRRPDTIDRACAEEFRYRPFDEHSPQLQRLLDRFRSERFPNKHVLVCTRPYREWTVAIYTGIRGDQPVPLPGHVYGTVEEAEWAVFKLRWQKHFGEELE